VERGAGGSVVSLIYLFTWHRQAHLEDGDHALQIFRVGVLATHAFLGGQWGSPRDLVYALLWISVPCKLCRVFASQNIGVSNCDGRFSKDELHELMLEGLKCSPR
jgi:hypothetical protein